MSDHIGKKNFEREKPKEHLLFCIEYHAKFSLVAAALAAAIIVPKRGKFVRNTKF